MSRANFHAARGILRSLCVAAGWSSSGTRNYSLVTRSEVRTPSRIASDIGHRKGIADRVAGVAVVSHDLVGLGDVPELFSRLYKSESVLGFAETPRGES